MLMDGKQLSGVAVGVDFAASSFKSRPSVPFEIGFKSRIRDVQLRPALSIVAPVYNEAEVLPEFYRRLAAVLHSLNLSSEIIFVNDGSTDASLITLRRLQTISGRIATVNLSRNFGKYAAISA